MQNAPQNNKPGFTPYLSVLGAWALAFGCAVGWGSFVMPGNTFLPIAGPVGSFIGLCLGAVIMLIIAANYHYLINCYPDAGGTYTYTKNTFGYDHGFLAAWFLILTYIAVAWANATALPLIARTLFGGAFQFGFHYEIAGYHVYFGEMLLAVGSLFIAACVCLRRSWAAWVQIVMALLLLGGVVLCFVFAMGRTRLAAPFEPAWAPGHSPFGGTFTIFALAPWAYVGFESITHSAAEAKYSPKKSFGIMAAALAAAGLVYGLLVLLAVTALPEGCSSWVEYLNRLGDYSGVAGQPTFFAANSALGTLGSAALGLAALGGIMTGLVGNFVALSRLLTALAEDGLLPRCLGELNRNHTPRNAILAILGVSVIMPFFGRAAISWIVDVTTVGATIAYAIASASAWKQARMRGSRLYTVIGLVGMAVSLVFAVEFLVPNILSVTTLSTESYLILAAWGILGFVLFRFLLKRDTEKRLGRSIVAWVVLLGTIIFTSYVWMRQTTNTAIEKAVAPIQSYYAEQMTQAGVDLSSGATRPMYGYLHDVLESIDRSMGQSIYVQAGLMILALVLLFDIYNRTQKRERQTEVEKALAEDASRAKTSFLSNMSHEIRTPMNAIIGLDNIALRNPDLQPQTREQLEKIGASARHLLGLINDILDMSRIESGRMVLKDEEFSFREFLDQINIIINGQCLDKGLHYECSIVGGVRDYYVGDDLKLKQVLINILGNSVKFTEAGGSVKLTVEPLGESDGRCTLRFTMTDTGIGMDKEFIPKIFDAFSQEDATSTNRYGGSGLGMAITKSFVEMMEGSIHVESEKGVGTTFTVTVTMGASDRVRELEHGIRLPEGLRALVVDDDEVSCEHAQGVLRAIGIEADTVISGFDALPLLREAWDSGRPYQLLLTDYRMPEMNGLELTKALRSFDGGETAVLLLTGYNWDIIADEARTAGVDGVVAKPLFSDLLARKIHSVLKRRSGDVAPESAEPEENHESSLAGRRVLMAEDVMQNAEILADLLELEDMEAEHAVNGQEAVEMFSAHDPGYYDVILMDVRMPVMDGLTAARTIRALDRPDAGTIPIIAMTANVFDEDVERSHAAGMNAHLSKPVEPERLYETMSRFIGAGQ